MTDLVPSAAQRLARFLKRDHCLWMASPSLAFLSAALSAAERPGRFLVLEGAPDFVAGIGKMLDIETAVIPESDAERAVQAALRAGHGAAVPWGVVTHRSGRLAEAESLSTFASQGVRTIEVCLGSLFAIERPSRATFTIVSLDAEEAFEGTQLSALLTDSRAAADQIQRLCLPGPGDSAQALDLSPRGLTYDEAGLRLLVDRAIERAEAAEGERRKQAKPSFTLAWKRLFQEAPEASPSVTAAPEDPSPAPRPVGNSVWLSRLAEAEERRVESLRASESEAAEYRKQAEEERATSEEWKRRAEAATAAAETAESGRASLLKERSELEARLAASVAKNETLAERLRLADGDLEIERSKAAAREEARQAEAEEERLALQRSIAELRTRIEDLSGERARESAGHGAALQEMAEARDAFKARVAELERDLARLQDDRDRARLRLVESSETHQADLLAAETRLNEARQALAGSKAARQADQERHEEAVKAAEAQRAELKARVSELQDALRVQARDGEASRAALNARLEELEGARAQLRDALQASETRLAEAREALAGSQAVRAAETASQAKEAKAAEARRRVLEDRVAELKGSLLAQTKEGEAIRAGLDARVRELDGTLSQLRDERDRALARVAEAAEAHRTALAAAETRVAEAREALAAAQATRTADQERHAEAARAAEAQRTALEVRVAELQERHAEAAKAAEAQRTALEARVAELKETLLVQTREAEGTLSQLRDERDRALARVAEAAEAHRTALAAAETRVAEAREALAAAQATRAADQERHAEVAKAAEAQRTALEVRAAELQERHAEVAKAAEAQRTALEVRVAELKETLLAQTKEGEAIRAGLDARVRELEGTLSQLRDERDRALARAAEAAEAHRTALAAAETRVAEAREALAAAQATRTADQERHAEAAKAAEAQREALEERVAELQERHADVAKAAQVQRTALEVRVAELKETLLAQTREAEGTLSQLRDERDRALARVAEAAEAHRTALAAAETRVAEAREALAAAQATRTADQERHAAAAKAAEAQRTALEVRAAELQERHAEVANAAETQRTALEARVAELKETLLAQTKEGGAIRAGLDARVRELDGTLSQLRDERDRALARVAEAAEAHRTALAAAETRVAEAREALAAAQATRTADQERHAEVAKAAETQRTALEVRAAELKETLLVQTREAEASRTALNARLRELEGTLSQLRDERDRALVRLAEAAEAHGTALAAAETRVAEAREELASLKGGLAAGSEAWTARIRGPIAANDSFLATLAAGSSATESPTEGAPNSEDRIGAFTAPSGHRERGRSKRAGERVVGGVLLSREVRRRDQKKDPGRAEAGPTDPEAQAPTAGWATRPPAWADRATDLTAALHPSEVSPPEDADGTRTGARLPAWRENSSKSGEHSGRSGADRAETSAQTRPFSHEDLRTSWPHEAASSVPTGKRDPNAEAQPAAEPSTPEGRATDVRSAGPAFEPEYEARGGAEVKGEAEPPGWLRGLAQRIRGR